MGSEDEWLARAKKRDMFNEEELRKLIWVAMEIFIMEPNVLHVTSSGEKLNVCGDVHGQFQDVKKMIDEVGSEVSSSNRYLFLGDYVDRGYYSVETITLLLAYKIKYPNEIYLIRGNHECRSVTQTYGFYEETTRKYGHAGVWKLFMELFDYLPIAAIVDDAIFCVHGGLSPALPTLDDITLLNRTTEIPSEGPLADLNWSDPCTNLDTWEHSYRGAGYLFGQKAVEQFLVMNDLKMVARAHQLAIEGYQEYFDKKLVTVWSAPNYSYRTKNKASIMMVKDGNVKEYRVFEAYEYKDGDLPPEYMDAIRSGK
ncbi:Serine/threonine-protein phosphatase [Giardia muris]|uniref:Serine/threonine-protein phosphatase n=1 Tax=Giardia muris TaxID=5742 RepID=A0A4Z1SM88_GIAMU|nr:Serine/threonine-protein phosphatase [Giardia muris]|eukprot:TNJ26804.1 Serine/threonine-protein phosphatase [Giardia muris]